MNTGTAYRGLRCARNEFEQVVSLRVEGVSISGTIVVVGGMRVVRGDAVAAVPAAGSERIDPEDLAEHRTEVLGEIQRISTASAIRYSEVEQPEVGVAGRRERVERGVSAVVVAKRLLDSQEHSRQATVVGRSAGVSGGELNQHGVVSVLPAARHKVGFRLLVLRIEPGI